MVATKPAKTVSPGRCVAMSRSGRYVVVAEARADGAKVEIVDAIGTAPRLLLSEELPGDFAVVGESVWLYSPGELIVYGFDSTELARAEIPCGEARLAPSVRQDAATALLSSADKTVLITYDEGEILQTEVASELTETDFAVSVHGTRVLAATDREFMIGAADRGIESRGGLPGTGTVIAGAQILGGKALALASVGSSGGAIDVVRPRGSLVHHIEAETLELVAFADVRGLGLIYGGGALVAYDLRYGRVLHTADTPLEPLAIAIDSEGRNVLMAGYQEGAARLSVYHVPFAEVFQKTSVVRHSIEEEEDAGADDVKDEAPVSAPEADQPSPPSIIEPETEVELEVPEAPLRALRDEEPLPTIEAPANVRPYSDPLEHLSDLLDLVVARTACAIANAWDSGELSQPLAEGLPFEKEVRALVGHRANAAPQLLAEATTAAARVTESIAVRTRATLAAGLRLPMLDIGRQFDLSPAALRIIPVVAAPSLRREAARLYGILSNDTARPVCDRALVETILAAGLPNGRSQVARELEASAPLLANGLLRTGSAGTSERLFAALSIDSVLLRRLGGDIHGDDGPGSITVLRRDVRPFAELVVPKRIKRDIVLALSDPGGPMPRIVIRGRPGFGRTSLLAALAAKVDMPLAVIDAERMPPGETFPLRLRGELQRAMLRGALPCIRGLENRRRDEHTQTEHVREVFRSFPGSIGFRTSVEYHPPLDPGFFSFTLPTLLESQRHEFWDSALSRRGLRAESVKRLAARYLVGPGTIDSIVQTVATRVKNPQERDDLTDELDSAARQHLEARLGDVANRVKRLARWEQVALPDDMIDSIREFIGRVVHRRTVYEKWGFADKMATSRGLTALFYGQPGTGKTMVAGLIARELGLDLYRVDLANVTSKWIGETEKNLGRVFDAAEDGQAVILFDEADSLFAKRTEVKSSVDRYANLEVNYLLQRFDSFEGVAILTTNMDGAIDSAFKRRLSLRLEFPFPDEEMRVRLWAAHIPTEAPTRGDFDFASLARRFPMSGGYIRNSALRAAFLAAQEGALLSHEHLERAIHLEYREMGKLSPGGRMA